MGEIKTFVDKETHIKVLQYEIANLGKKYQPTEEGTGHFNTAISVLKARIKEIENNSGWPYHGETN